MQSMSQLRSSGKGHTEPALTGFCVILGARFCLPEENIKVREILSGKTFFCKIVKRKREVQKKKNFVSDILVLGFNLNRCNFKRRQ